METDGVEHNESSDNRVPARTFQDPNISDAMTDLLPHEFTHSWNGKYRRPAGLATPNYQEPMKGNLLWVYEGMTQYYGTMLSARIGSWTPERLRENLAWVAAYLDHRKGRSWRDLEDTAVTAQLLYGSPEEYRTWRRDTDYYDEGTLIWLEADTIIRQVTKGKNRWMIFADNLRVEKIPGRRSCRIHLTMSSPLSKWSRLTIGGHFSWSA